MSMFFLLSSFRRQFPSPVVQSSPLPSIPSWQRNDIQLNIDEGVFYIPGQVVENERSTLLDLWGEQFRTHRAIEYK